MKKGKVFLAVVFLLCANLGWAEDVSYAVKRGDTKSGIAARVFGIAYKDLSLEAIRNPTIHPGEIIRRSNLVGSTVSLPSDGGKFQKSITRATANGQYTPSLQNIAKRPLNPHLTRKVEFDANGRRVVREFNVARFMRYAERTDPRQIALDRAALIAELSNYGVGKEKVDEILAMHRVVCTNGIDAVPEARMVQVEDGTEADFMLYANNNRPGAYLKLTNIVIYYGDKTQFAYVYPVSSERELWYEAHCGNWTLVRTKPEEPSIPPPPKPCLLPPPQVFEAPLQEALNAKYEEQVRKMWEIDLIVGGAHQRYSDGGQDYNQWMYASIRYITEVGEDGNTYKFGPYFRGSTYRGTWDDPKGQAPQFGFHGHELEFGPEFRVVTQDMMEYILNVGYVTQTNHGGSHDKWGESVKSSEFSGGRLSVGMHDMSRLDERFLPEWQARLTFTQEFSSKKQNSWTDKNGKCLDFEDRKTITGPSASISAVLAQTDDKLLSLSIELWGQWTGDDKVGKATGYVRFFDGTFGIGPQFTLADYNGDHVFGYGPAWYFDFYRGYKYLNRDVDPLEAEFENGQQKASGTKLSPEEEADAKEFSKRFHQALKNGGGAN